MIKTLRIIIYQQIQKEDGKFNQTGVPDINKFKELLEELS